MLLLTKKKKQEMINEMKKELEQFFQEQWEKIQQELQKDGSSWSVDYEAEISIDL